MCKAFKTVTGVEYAFIEGSMVMGTIICEPGQANWFLPKFLNYKKGK